LAFAVLLSVGLGCQKKTNNRIIVPTGTYADPGEPIQVGGGRPQEKSAPQAKDGKNESPGAPKKDEK
jgi:hypothetical protein